MSGCVDERIDPGVCRAPLGAPWRFELVHPHRAGRAERATPLAEFAGGDLSGSVTFLENELGESEAVLPDGDWCNIALRHQLNDMTPQVEGWWFRGEGNNRVHCGPVIDVTDRRDGTIVVTTRDRLWWEDVDTPIKRIIIKDEDLTRLWLKYVSPQALHLRLNAVCAGIDVTRDFDPDDFLEPTALSAARDIAEEGLSWTIVDDSLFVGPIDRLFEPATITISDEDWDQPPAFSLNGDRFADLFVVIGNRDIEPRPFGFWPPVGQPRPEGRWVRSTRITVDEQIRNESQASSKARRIWERRHHSDALVAPESASLQIPAPGDKQTLEWCPHTLLPGRAILVESLSRLSTGPITMIPTKVVWKIAAGYDAAVQPAMRSTHE